jgi:hypothetical protein
VGERVWKRFRRGREDQKWYYTSLVAALSSKGGNASYEKLYEELRRKVKEVFSEFEKKEDQA